MPQIRYYKVTQTREVRVSATNMLDAATLASRAFAGTKHPADQIDIHGSVQESALNIEVEKS